MNEEINTIEGTLENILETSNAGSVRMSAGEYHYIVCTDEVWEDIERVLDEREDEEKVGEWIPVSERLPEPEDDVIVSCKSCRIGKKYTSTDYRSCKTGEWSYFGNDVIAWQPLPEPYREDGVVTERQEKGTLK